MATIGTGPSPAPDVGLSTRSRALSVDDVSVLDDLVRDAAAGLGVPAPRRVVLGACAEVRGAVGVRGSRLLIGLPAVYVLGRAELRALVEHEVAALAAAPGVLAQARYRRWTRAMDVVASYGEEEEPPRLSAAVARGLGGRAVPIEQAADLGRGNAGPVAARAWIRLGRASDDFLIYCQQLEEALSRFGGLRYRIVDLHDGWRQTLSDNLAEAVDPDEAAEAGRRHPGLAGAAASLVGEMMSLRPPADPVRLAPLSRREQRRLSAELLAVRGRVPWRTFAQVPPKVWRRAAARDARDVTRAVARALGREPVDAAEMADVIRARPAEVAGAPIEELDVPVFQSHGWLLLAEAALLADGWTRAHPGRPGVVDDGRGTRVDLHELTAEAVRDPFSYARLRELLTPAG